MLGPTDIQRLATMIDPERDGLEMGEVEEVDINHLDFGYVESCKNTKELLELLRFLKYSYEFDDLEVERKGFIRRWRRKFKRSWQS